jgi:hypothetical protein
LLLEKREALAKSLLSIAITEYLEAGKSAPEFEKYTRHVLARYWDGIGIDSYSANLEAPGVNLEGDDEPSVDCSPEAQSLIDETYQRLKGAGESIYEDPEDLKVRWNEAPVASLELGLQIKVANGVKLTREEHLLLYSLIQQARKRMNACTTGVESTEE